MREREILVVVENRGERWGRKGRDDWSAKLRRHEAPTFDSFVFPCSLSPPSSFFAFCFSFLLFYRFLFFAFGFFGKFSN